MTVSGLTMSKEARHSSQIRDNQTQNRRSFVLIAGRFWVRFRMASCCHKARFSKAKLHRLLSVALKKQHSKDSNSLIPIECRARPQKVNDINGYEVLAKDSLIGGVGGSFIHALLAIAAIALLYKLLGGRRMMS
jgi:hypothetical protein